MKIKLILTVAALAAVTITSKALALGIGDAAPEINASKWVKGDAVHKLEADKTYVVEFWATWCGPCLEIIPHLTEMAHTYAGNQKRDAR
jgi:thiol-disulfide isomerase/thioredoxin